MNEFDEKFRKHRLDLHFDESIRMFCEEYAPIDTYRNHQFYMHLMGLLRTHGELVNQPFIKSYETAMKATLTLPLMQPKPIVG